ncbi:endo-polygalacturonase PG1 [Mycena rosella]|uniref:endo-polygalacturonase n=1 Tax=Mycena rosella TaxID=1033263 RepID=A0AAD7M8C8_MYCRO|nr:endo-polygalacturonase PG1 [Mycena rosella]
MAACTGTISSLADVAAAVACTTVNINGFTVPAGSTFTLNLLAGTTVNLRKTRVVGDITFGTKNWAGPLFAINGASVTFNGNGHTFDGNGAFYWDGLGSGTGASTKPRPMMKVKISGFFSNVNVLNSPAQVYSIDNVAPLVISQLTIDNTAGDAPNSISNGQPAARNTDGFDVGIQAPLTIQSSTIKNQDDCIAINDGSNILFTNNTCCGGHGISIGSIDSGVVVSNITITNNVVTNSAQAFRIKTEATATGSSVSGVTYSGNRASGLTSFGVIIDQSYPSTLGTPGSGVAISDIDFSGGANTVAINSGVTRVAVNCGSGSCSGSWDWSALTMRGGVAGEINYAGITGFTNP